MDELKNLRLGFVTARSAFGDGQLWTDAGTGRLLDVWVGQCRHVTAAFSYAPERKKYHDYRLHLGPDNFFPLPWLSSFARGIHKARSCRKVIRQVEQRSDVVLVQLPFASPLALLGATRPRVYHVVSDIWEVARNSTLYSGLKRIPGLIVGGAVDRLQNHLVHARQARIVTNGSKLLLHYRNPPGRAVVSATILEREVMSVRRQRPENAPFRILYVGYLRHDKGADVLLQAFARLRQVLPSAELHFVGSKHTVDHGMVTLLEETARELNLVDSVRFVGQIPFGPELFQSFADADVLAVPSRSEGTPRVMIEARAFGCTVVGTTVGGIPSSITTEVDGLLVPPEDPAALADAMLRIAQDSQFRARLIEGGLARVRMTTIEAYARAIGEEILNVWRGSADRGRAAISAVASNGSTQ